MAKIVVGIAKNMKDSSVALKFVEPWEIRSFFIALKMEINSRIVDVRMIEFSILDTSVVVMKKYNNEK